MIDLHKYDIKNIDDKNYNNILYKKDTGFWTLINRTGLEIIKQLKCGASIEEIANNLAEEYSLEYDDIVKDVAFFVDDLMNRVKIFEKDLKNYVETSGEQSLTIHVTNRCNLKCPYCYKDANCGDIKDELTADDIIKTISDAKKSGFTYIIFSGGEPTVREDFFEIIQFIHKNIKDLKLCLITNGTTNLSNEKLDILVECIDVTQISLDSCEEEINALTRGSGSLKKTLDFVEQLKARDYKNFYFASTPTTSQMSDNPSVKKLPSLLRFSANEGAKGLYVNMLKPDGRMDDSSYSNFDIDEYWEMVNETYSELRLLYTIGFHELVLFAGSDFNNILEGYYHSPNCGLGCTELSINHDGNVYPCSSLMKNEFVLGNIKDSSISDLFKKSCEIYSKVNVNNFENCKDCADKYICGGGCRALAYAATGDINGKNPHCRQCKDRIITWQLLSRNL